MTPPAELGSSIPWGGVLLLTLLLKSVVLLAAALALTRLLRPASAALRHLALSAALAVVLALPVLSALVPAWRVRVLPQLPVASWLAAAARPSASAPAPLPQTAPSTATAAAATQPSHAGATPSAGPASAGRTGWLGMLGALWVAGCGVLLLRYGVAALRLRSLARRAVPVEDDGWAGAAARASERLGLRRSVPLRRCQADVVPMVWGVVNPVILLPDASRDWTAERREVVLLHEMAHIQRRDPLAHLVAQVCQAVYWFNPLVWMAERRLRDERERACDDHVLRAGADATDYANHLLQIVRAFGRGPSASPALAMARRSQFEGRMLAILDPGLRRGRVSRRAAGVAGALAMLAVLPLAALSPMPRAAAAEGADASLAAADSVPLQIRAIAQQYGVPHDLAAAIVRAARAEGVDVGLAVLLVRIESGFHEDRVSARGTVGLTQILPSTAATLQPGITPAQLAARETNLRLGFRHLRALLDQYRGDASLALTAYHTGPRAVERMREAGVASAPVPAAPPRRPAAGAAPPRSEMDRMVDLVPSDGDRAALLMNALGPSPGLALQLDVIRASERIRSAGDRARVLMSLLARRDLGMEALTAVLAATDGMDDGDRARVLMALLEDYGLSAALMPAFFQATRSLSSDGEHARVLHGVVARAPRGELELGHVLECAAHIRSDGAKVGVLMAVADGGPLSGSTRTRYLRVVETIESDGDRRTALTGLAAGNGG